MTENLPLTNNIKDVAGSQLSSRITLQTRSRRLVRGWFVWKIKRAQISCMNQFAPVSVLYFITTFQFRILILI